MKIPHSCGKEATTAISDRFWPQCCLLPTTSNHHRKARLGTSEVWMPEEYTKDTPEHVKELIRTRSERCAETRSILDMPGFYVRVTVHLHISQQPYLPREKRRAQRTKTLLLCLRNLGTVRLMPMLAIGRSIIGMSHYVRQASTLHRSKTDRAGRLGTYRQLA